jgi:peptidoglycan/LPS O-acetylase OafA/YrhL
MLVAAALETRAWRTAALVAGMLVLAALPLHQTFGLKHALVRCGCAALLAGFALHRQARLPVWLHATLDRLSAALGGGVFRFMGEVSYGVYLLHLIVMLPVAALVASNLGTGAPSALRAGLCLAIVLPLAYGGAWLLLVTVERPGIALGRQVVTGFGIRRRPTVAARTG